MKSNQDRNGNAKVLRVAVASVFALVGATSHAAGTAQQNLAVTANVPTNCLIATTALAFGAYDPIQANAGSSHLDNNTGKVTVTCTKGSSPVITLGQGLTPDGSSSAAAPLRRLAKGGDYLAYGLYKDAARTQVWGDTAGTGYAVANPTGAAQEVTVYGRIDGGQNVPFGDYADTVVATVTF
jgi:spore coat protein U-like protein